MSYPLYTGTRINDKSSKVCLFPEKERVSLFVDYLQASDHFNQSTIAQSTNRFRFMEALFMAAISVKDC